MTGRNPLAELLLGDTVPDAGRDVLTAALLTAWNTTTYENTVTDGAATWTNLAVLNPSLLALGRVLLGRNPSGRGAPVILGNTYVYVPPTPPET